jgi:hypothetical protein
MRSLAWMLMTLRTQHEEQPFDVALSVHEYRGGQAACRSQKGSCADTYADEERRRSWSRKECPTRDGRVFRASGRVRGTHHYGWGRGDRSFFCHRGARLTGEYSASEDHDPCASCGRTWW